MNGDRTFCRYSVVIPVFNSEGIVGETVDRTISFFRNEGLELELILVNDGSKDQSWTVIQNKAEENPEVVAINLLRNYGQHVANLCGFQLATGDYIITMDDDLQNPPDEIAKLIKKAHEGHDLVIGQFKESKHSFVRRIGSRIVGAINRRIFHSDNHLVLTNFRIIHRDVVDRVCRHKTSYPYIPGMVLMFSSNRANVLVEHQDRQTGKSNYNIWRILKLVSEILFNYSSYPLRIVCGMGLLMAMFSFLVSTYYLMRWFFRGITVPGWTTIIVLLSFFNGMALLVLGMLGEYIIRLINQNSSTEYYHVKKIVRL